MINEQINVIRKIKEKLIAANFIVGDYPFDIEKAIGDWDRYVLIQDGDETIADFQQNGSIIKDYSITLWLYSNKNKQRIDHILYMQAEIESIIMPAFNTHLYDTVECVQFDSVEKGEYLEEFTGYEPGYTGNKSCRKINYTMRIRQMR